MARRSMEINNLASIIYAGYLKPKPRAYSDCLNASRISSHLPEGTPDESTVLSDFTQDRDVAASCEIATGLKCGNRITENGR